MYNTTPAMRTLLFCKINTRTRQTRRSNPCTPRLRILCTTFGAISRLVRCIHPNRCPRRVAGERLCAFFFSVCLFEKRVGLCIFSLISFHFLGWLCREDQSICLVSLGLFLLMYLLLLFLLDRRPWN